MAHAVPRAAKLSAQWKDFREAGSIMYDVLLWQDMKWPALSLAWLPQSTWSQPPAIAAAEAAAKQARQRGYDFHAAAAAAQQAEDSKSEGTAGSDAPADNTDAMEVDDEAEAAAAGNDSHTRPQLVPMPVEYQYLLTGTQTSGREKAHLELYRVEVPGTAGDLQPNQQVLMQKGDVQLIMSICHGMLDVNRLAVMPSQPNIVCTSCDEPEVYLFDLRQHPLWPQGQAANGELPGNTTGSGAAGDDQDNEAASSSDAADASDAGSEHDSGSEEGSASVSTADEADTMPPHPQAVLTGRSAGGFGLEFNPVRSGLLLGGDAEGGVQLWDVEGFCSNGSSSGGGGSGGGAVPRIPPVQKASGFVPCAINDVSWHRQGSAYALATERGQVWVQDLRAPPADPSSSSGSNISRHRHGLTAFRGPGVQQPDTAQIHVWRERRQHVQQQQQQQPDRSKPKDCFCVAFDPLHDHRLASAGADGFINTLDLRSLDEPIDKLGMHAGSVTSLAWSHTLPGLLASAGEDGAVLLWDANKLQHAGRFQDHHHQQQQQQAGLGLPQPSQVHGVTEEVRQLSLPGLLFMHGGHLGRVGSLALNPERPWLMASSSEGIVAALNSAGRNVVVQRQPLMVWEVNRSRGLLC